MFRKLAAFAALAYASQGVTIKCNMDVPYGYPIAPIDLNKDFRIHLEVTADQDWVQASAGGGGVFGYRSAPGGNFGLYARNKGGALHYAIHAGDVTGNVVTTGSFGHPAFYKYDMKLGQTYDMVIAWTGGLFTWTIDGNTVVSRDAPNGFGSHHHVARMCYGVGGGASGFKGTVKVLQMDYDVQEFHECEMKGVSSPDMDLSEDFRIELQVTADAAFVQESSGGGGVFGFRDFRPGRKYLGNFGLYARNKGGALHYAIHAGDITGNVVTTGSFGQPAFYKFDMELGRTYAMTIERKQGKFTWVVDRKVVLHRDAPNGFGAFHPTAVMCTGVGGGARGFKGSVAVLNMEYEQFCPPIPDAHGPWCWNTLTPPVATDKTEAECKDLCRDNPECQYALTGPGWCQNCKHSPFPIKATLPGSSQQYMHAKKTASPNGECQESPFCNRIPDAHGPWCSNILNPPVAKDKTETECKALCAANPRCRYALTGPEWCQNCAHSPFPTQPTLPGSLQAFMHPKKQFSPNGQCE